MQSVIAALLAFLQAHAGFTGSITIWMVLSFVVNILLAIKGPAGWVTFAEKNPTIAMIVNVLFRVFGIDLVGLIQHIQAWLNSKAQPQPTLTEKK
jgi:hypothetical protein